METIKCSYCGKVPETVSFWIGAAPQHGEDETGHTGFTLHEGTGKYSCLECRQVGETESIDAIESATGLKIR